LTFASHSSRNEDELNPEFLCSLFYYLFATRTGQLPEHDNGSALDPGTEPVKIVTGDKRAHPSIGLAGKDQFATPDVLLLRRIVAVAPLATFRLALPQNPPRNLPPGCIDAGECGQAQIRFFVEHVLHPISPDVPNRRHLMTNQAATFLVSVEQTRRGRGRRHNFPPRQERGDHGIIERRPS
jgi:hypothetical protein